MGIDVQKNINTFTNEFKKEHHRYSSFDHCFVYFQTNKGKNLIKNKELSCLHLGFYLASWGMYRGSSFLLQNSYMIYSDLIDYLSKIDSKFWNIDIDSYTDENIDKILDVYKGIKNKLFKDKKHKSETLITKIMLGVFGNIPAFDTYFKKGIKSINGDGMQAISKNNLVKIKKIYEEYQKIYDKQNIKCTTVDNNNPEIKYTKAKLIDMTFFIEGMKIAKKNKNMK